MTNDTKPIPAGVLPELPAPELQFFAVYTADQIRAYATEAVRQSLAQPAATYDSERAAMVAKYGDCCGGGDPMCWGGCLVQKAISRSEATQPAPAQSVVLEAVKQHNAKIAKLLEEMQEDFERREGQKWPECRTDAVSALGSAIYAVEQLFNAAPTPPTEAQRDELALFEAWAQTNDGNCSETYGDLKKLPPGHEDGLFVNPLVQRDWDVWQAAIASVKGEL